MIDTHKCHISNIHQMKPSIYNSYFNFSDGIQMIYNAYTDMFILLRSKMIVDSHNIISADTIDPNFMKMPLNRDASLRIKLMK